MKLIVKYTTAGQHCLVRISAVQYIAVKKKVQTVQSENLASPAKFFGGRSTRLTLAQWLSIGFALLIIGLAIYLSWPTSTEEPSDDIATSEASVVVQASDHLRSVQYLFDMGEITYDGHITPYRVDTFGFDTGLGAATPAVHVLLDDDAVATYIKELRQYFTKNSFKETAVNNSTAQTTTLDAVFVHDDVICEAVNMEHDEQRTDVSISCVDKSQLRDYATAQAPFFDIYREHTSTASVTVVGYPSVVNSKAFGYEYSLVTIGDPYSGSSATAYFYRVPDDTTWHYFTTSDKTIPCESFAARDIRYAFSGLTCHDTKTDGELTVSIDLK